MKQLKLTLIAIIILTASCKNNNDFEAGMSEMITKAPDDIKAFINKDYRTFIDINLEKIKNDSTNYISYDKIGSGYILISKNDSAKIFLNKSLALNSESNAEAYRYLGAIAIAEKDTLKSIDFYSRALLIKPKSKEILYEFGTVAEYIGSFGDAGEMYNKVLKIDPNYKDAKVRLQTLIDSNFYVEKTKREIENRRK